MNGERVHVNVEQEVVTSCTQLIACILECAAGACNFLQQVTRLQFSLHYSRRGRPEQSWFKLADKRHSIAARQWSRIMDNLAENRAEDLSDFIRTLLAHRFSPRLSEQKLLSCNCSLTIRCISNNRLYRIRIWTKKVNISSKHILTCAWNCFKFLIIARILCVLS